MTWQLQRRRIKACERACVNLVDLNPPDHDQIHVKNSKPSITLVKSNGCDLISHLANDRRHAATRGPFDEDRTTKIKEDVGVRRRIMVHLSHVMWHHCDHSRCLKRMKQPRFIVINSSINRSSLLWKCNFGLNVKKLSFF